VKAGVELVAQPKPVSSFFLETQASPHVLKAHAAECCCTALWPQQRSFFGRS